MTEPTGAVLTVGETMLLLSGTEPGEVAELEHLRVDTGGAESNVAIGLVRAGVPATWVGRVGADPAGDRVLRDVRSAGVDVVPVVDPDRSTGLMVKERLHDGRTRVTYHRRHSAASALVPEDVPAGLVERAAAVHLTGITLALSDTARATVQAVLDRADAAGVPVSFDVNHRAKLIDAATARGYYRAVAERADVLFAGDDEARLLLGLGDDEGTDEDLAHALAAVSRGPAVVKAGSRGAVAVVDGRTLRRPATPVRVVDPVGAGDAFVAAWLAATLTGAPPETALDRAADAGALACTVAGDWRRPDPAALHRPDTPDTADVHDRVDR
ncbi:sugar kinase [uncultured Curtobacterium sp.]|uniref:sugar kinase n=1 Tax=uncultured Curtobacterium sp. TaxID=331964 RepID=UPI00258707B1|nr:sugar kinase [uncultured Curtobacterium sp.]